MAPVGHFVFTPLVRPTGERILVNRGWISAKDWNQASDSTASDSIQPRGEVRILGYVSKPDNPGRFAPINDVEGHQFSWKDFPEMRRALGLSENAWILDCVEIEGIRESESIESAESPFVLKSVDELLEHAVIPFTHVVYATTWYFLSFAGSAMMWFMFRGPRG